jgi:SMC interacting uncharacterized protein involved in chromosome segregation
MQCMMALPRPTHVDQKSACREPIRQTRDELSGLHQTYIRDQRFRDAVVTDVEEFVV